MKKIFFLSLVCLITSSFGASQSDSIRIDSIMQEMTIEEKIGQMIIVYHANYAFLEQYKIGAVLIMQNMLEEPLKLIKNLQYAQKNLHIPLLVTIDQEGGKINRLKKIPGWNLLPSAATIAEWDSLRIARYAYKVGVKLKSLGVNTNLAPVLDPSTDQFGKETFMYATRRSFGSNSDTIFNASTAFVAGMKEAGILCFSKHYPGYDVEDNSDHAITVSNADTAFIKRNSAIFNRSMKDVAGTMISSIHYPALCQTPSVFCPEIIAMVREVDFDKLIITDDLWGASLRAYISKTEQVHPTRYPKEDLELLIKKIFIAGNDMLMTTYPKTVPIIIQIIKEMTLKDPKYLEQVNNSTRRVLLAKNSIGLLDAVNLSEWRAEKIKKAKFKSKKSSK